MTDDKLTAARRALAQIADQCTDAIMRQSRFAPPSTWHIATLQATEQKKIANETLVTIREIAQDAAEATLDKVETRT